MSELNRSATLRTWSTMRRMPTIVVVLVLVAVAGVGCGWQKYESRMAESAEYFDYLGQAQAVLVDADQSDVSSFGVKIRVPVRFRWIGPKMQDDGDGNQVPVPAREDKKRQPRFAQNGLPGLLGSWYSVVSDDSGKTRTGSSWMFLFGNYQRYKDRAAGINVEPSTFYDNLVNELADAIGVPAPLGGEWQYEKVDKLGGYYIASGGSNASPENHYTLIKLESRGTEYRLYLHPGPRTASSDDGGGDAPGPGDELQFALLFVVPRNATQPARLESGIKYCLEWFEADTTVPSFDGDGDGGGPATGF